MSMVLLFISFDLLLEREKEAKESGRCQVTWRGGMGRIWTLDVVVSNMCYMSTVHLWVRPTTHGPALQGQVTVLQYLQLSVLAHTI